MDVSRRVICFLIVYAAGAVLAASPGSEIPHIGAGARFQAAPSDAHWQRGFFNQIRTVPPCYILITFKKRAGPDAPLQLDKIYPLAHIQRLQVTDEAAASLGSWRGLAMAEVPQTAWREVDLEQIRASQGRCPPELLPQ